MTGQEKNLSDNRSKSLHKKNLTNCPLSKNLLGLLLVTMATLPAMVSGHGYMLEPPSRASAYRVPGYESWPINYDDNQMYCGGRVVRMSFIYICCFFYNTLCKLFW